MTMMVAKSTSFLKQPLQNNNDTRRESDADNDSIPQLSTPRNTNNNGRNAFYYAARGGSIAAQDFLRNQGII